MSFRTSIPFMRGMLMSSRTTSGRARQHGPERVGAVQRGLHVVVALEVLGEHLEDERLVVHDESRRRIGSATSVRVQGSRPLGDEELLEGLPHRLHRHQTRALQVRAASRA